MSWKSLSVGKAKSASNPRSTTSVVTTTFTNFDARYQALKTDAATLIGKLYASKEEDAQKSLLDQLQPLSVDIQVVVSKFESQPSSFEWKQLLLDVNKCMLQCKLESCDYFEHRHELFLLGLQSLTLMEDLHLRDIGLISSVLEAAILCKDRWTYDNLLAQYSSCFTGIYQALLHKTRNAARLLPYSTHSIPLVTNIPLIAKSIVEEFEAPVIASSAVALLLLQRLIDYIHTTAAVDAKEQISKLRHISTSTLLTDHTLTITIDSDTAVEAMIVQPPSKEDQQGGEEEDRRITRFRGPIIPEAKTDISESNSPANNVDEVLAAIFDRWLHDEPSLSDYDQLDFIQTTFVTHSLAIVPPQEVAIPKVVVQEMDVEVAVINLDFFIDNMQTVINTLNTSSPPQQSDVMTIYSFNKQLLSVLTSFSHYVSSLNTIQLKQIKQQKIFSFTSLNLAVITLFARIVNVQQSYHLPYGLTLVDTVFVIENIVNFLDTTNTQLDRKLDCKLALNVLHIALQHIPTLDNRELDLTWRVRIIWVGCRLSLSRYGASYHYSENNRMHDVLLNLQTLGTMITEIAGEVQLPHVSEEYAVVNALNVAKLIDKTQALTLSSASSSSTGGSGGTGVKIMNEIIDSFDIIKLEHFLSSSSPTEEKKTLSVIEVLHTLSTSNNKQLLLSTWQGIRKVLSVFTTMATSITAKKMPLLFLQTLSEVMTIIQHTHQSTSSTNNSRKKDEAGITKEIKDICSDLTTILQVYIACEYNKQEMKIIQHFLPLIISLNNNDKSQVNNVIQNACLQFLFTVHTPTNSVVILYQLLASTSAMSLLIIKAVIRALCSYHLPNLDCMHPLFKYYMSLLTTLLLSLAHVLTDYDTLEFVFYVYNSLGDHGIYAGDLLPAICRCTSEVLVAKVRLLEKVVVDESSEGIVADKVYDAYLVLANCYQVLYNLPLTSYTTYSSSHTTEEVNVTTATNMYQLVQKCGNLRDFTKQDIRDSLLWLLELTVVKQVLVGVGGKWKKWLLQVYNNDSDTHIPAYSDEDDENGKLLSHIYFDLLELGLVVTGPESLCKQAEFLSLIEAYPFLRCLERNAAMDIKLKQSVEYAVQDLYFHPLRLESWSMLFVKFQDAALSLTDTLHETVDYYHTQAYFDRMLTQFEVENGKEGTVSIEESIWKMDPECWVNDIIPWVDRFYRYLTINDNHLEQFNQWKVESFAEETFQQRLIPNKTARFYCFKDFSTFVKGLLFTYRLKRYFDKAVHKTYGVIVNNDFQRHFDAGVDTSVLQHSLVEIHEVYGLSLSFLAKDYPRRSEGRKKYLQQALNVYCRDEVQEESIFAAVNAAKWLWQLHRHERSNEAIEIVLNVRKKLVDNEQIIGKTYRIHSWYQCHSLSSKFALWILFNSALTNALSSQTLTRLLEAFGVDHDESNDQQGMAWMVLVESVRQLIDCRKRDPYHFRTHYRLSDIIFKLYRAQIVAPEDIKNQLKMLLNIPDVNYQAALSELHSKLFDKKRQQIVAMWAVDSPNHAWDQMTARVSEFDSLRRKFIDRYLLLAKLCGEVEMIYNLAQQTFGKLSTATLHYVLHQSIIAMLAAIPIKLQSISQDDPMKPYQTKLSLLELVHALHVAMNKRKHLSSLIPLIESCLRELLVAFSNDSVMLVETYSVPPSLVAPEIIAADLIKPTPEAAASGLKAVHILLPQQTTLAATFLLSTAAETAMDVAEPIQATSKTAPIIALTFNHSWGNKEVISQVSSILSLLRKLSQPEGAAGNKRGRGAAAKEQRESSNELPSSKSPRLSQAETATGVTFALPELVQQQQPQFMQEDFEEQVML